MKAANNKSRTYAIRMDLESMLDGLNDSEAGAELESLVDSMRTIETVETEADFRANLNDAIHAAESLAKALTALRDELCP
jgi:hypothetical protein